MLASMAADPAAALGKFAVPWASWKCERSHMREHLRGLGKHGSQETLTTRAPRGLPEARTQDDMPVVHFRESVREVPYGAKRPLQQPAEDDQGHQAGRDSIAGHLKELQPAPVQHLPHATLASRNYHSFHP